MGIDIPLPEVQVPYVRRPEDANGFPSRGVYGNFLTHLGILREAWKADYKGYGCAKMMRCSVDYAARTGRAGGEIAAVPSGSCVSSDIR